jgi:colanic acid biosynthesis protein WcaH
MVIHNDLYGEIIRVMPIPCVDLVVTDKERRVLLLRRKNEPMKGDWWFPGGRVFFLEPRIQAAERKLKEECNLDALWMTELGTYELINNIPDSELFGHWITTLFHVRARQPESLKLDGQSTEAEWQSLEVWKSRNLHKFVVHCLNNFAKTTDEYIFSINK